MKDNKWENQYKNNILSLMPLKTKKEKNYVKDYMVSVNEFCMEFPNANYDDIIENFGEPKSVVVAYLKECDENYLLKKINTRNIVKKAAGSIIVIICCLSLISTYLLYKGYQEARESYITREEVFIEE